jgi:uncharacterized DUF497 family protein
LAVTFAFARGKAKRRHGPLQRNRCYTVCRQSVRESRQLRGHAKRSEDHRFIVCHQHDQPRMTDPAAGADHVSATKTIPLLVEFSQVDSFAGRFEWDAAKAEANVTKHKISFESAAKLFDDPYVVLVKDRIDETGEQRARDRHGRERSASACHACVSRER